MEYCGHQWRLHAENDYPRRSCVKEPGHEDGSHMDGHPLDEAWFHECGDGRCV